MTERTDTDALLIGALYGELTPVEEARLTAHLESHPADRTVLAGLQQVRAAVHESRIFTVSVEPPQSVSALLLQEAARRAPKPERAVVGWFHRFTRSFLMHPAMAAATMLVLVVGVAGTIYVRRGALFVEMAAPAVTAEQVQAEGEVPPRSAAVAAPASLETERTPDDSPDDKGTGAMGKVDVAAGSGAYRDGLDEAGHQPIQAAPYDREPPSGRGRARSSEDPPKPAAPMPAKPAKKSKAGLGIELRGAEMAPKDFAGETNRRESRQGDRREEQRTDLAKRELANADAGGGRAAAVTGDSAAQAPRALTAGGAAAAPGIMPPQNVSPAPRPAEPAPVATNSAKAKAPAKPVSGSRLAQDLVPSPEPASPPPSSTAGLPAAAAAPPNLPRDDRQLADQAAAMPADATLAGEKTAEDKAPDKAPDKALIDWAQKQRDQVLAFVKSNNCRAAARAAAAIYSRAPGYYAATIATDRSIKPCIAYVNNERERVDRSRAAMKRANADEAPAAASPPTRK